MVVNYTHSWWAGLLYIKNITFFEMLSLIIRSPKSLTFLSSIVDLFLFLCNCRFVGRTDGFVSGGQPADSHWTHWGHSLVISGRREKILPSYCKEFVKLQILKWLRCCISHLSHNSDENVSLHRNCMQHRKDRRIYLTLKHTYYFFNCVE